MTIVRLGCEGQYRTACCPDPFDLLEYFCFVLTKKNIKVSSCDKVA
jgi:hypothetical protein